ncbi:2-polyprenyl-6-methoxyphenol hydroxylase-like FAD-dependent oxidoreductase [Actinomycetospora succinea]|uniref:2-polyprenyl-6-methoxyphenol hydroxylase-like FAD-dependent oxidoreductase n=1 Tax=Actinomycetospora succinea TaxID=663603 RepID=A0A4R6VIS7_9PSEU|nr:FAD-dependent monooxygenase [Actinomycetospora succinea]TDQ63167.1 2-polyprenyl-6-methoxyphenol hydroxylase-like FAD-dependent oxidoreductase [Actinomycetospora succinea]
MTDVLVSGGGVAGATTAYWLRHHGFTPVVVESSPRPRHGGQAVDVRGPALTVAERMGVADELRAARTDMRGMSVVDEDGTELMRTTELTLTGGPVDGPDVEILRDDLVDVLLRATRDVEYLYGERVVGIDDTGARVRVELASGARRDVDLVVGADGQFSTVRRLAFGPDDDGRLYPLGQHMAVFTLPNTFGLDRWQVFLQRPEAMVGLYTARRNTEVRAVMGWADAEVRYDHRDLEQQRRLVTEAFAAGGWRIPEILAGMAGADDFYLTPMTQIRMPSWSRRRVALVGDAAYCATAVSGQGTSLAMVGAYVLAGELARGTGAGAYQQRMQGFVDANQHLALVNAEKTRQLTGAEEAVEGFDAHWVASAATAIDLPEY